MGSGSSEGREPLQVWLRYVDLAEDAGLLVGNASRVHAAGVFGGKEVPTLPGSQNIHIYSSKHKTMMPHV